MKKNFSFFLLSSIIILLNNNLIYSQIYSVNKTGTVFCTIENKKFPGLFLTKKKDSLAIGHEKSCKILWRKTNLSDGFFFLDVNIKTNNFKRLLATSYLGARFTPTGLEGRNDDVRWRLVPTDKENWYFMEHKSTRKFLSIKNNSFVLVGNKDLNDEAMWKITSKKIDLAALESPIIMMGNDKTGFRDPTVIYHEGLFYMYYSLVLTEEDEKIYWYVAYSKSEDLISWTDPVIITCKDQNKNFASPGNVIRFNNEWILCMQTYVMPGYTRKDKLRFGNDDCRIWITRSEDLENWSEPEMLWVMGKGNDPGHMIDPYLIEDKDEKGKWWCFFKKNGVSYSYSYDLKNWDYYGSTKAGENVCVWLENGEYYMMHSPPKGMQILKSRNLNNWITLNEKITLGQEDWQHWAGQRVTAGFVLDLRSDPRIGKYLLFFHGQGPPPRSTEIINSGTDLGIAWSYDLINWEYPGKIKKSKYK
jgi:hypothetical protein